MADLDSFVFKPEIRDVEECKKDDPCPTRKDNVSKCVQEVRSKQQRWVVTLHNSTGKQFVQFLELMTHIGIHRCLVKFLGFRIAFPCYVVFEKEQDVNNLRESIEDGDVNDATAQATVIIGVATAMMHLHAFGVAHGHLCLENILMTQQGHPKVSDYGYEGLTDPRDLAEDVRCFGEIVRALCRDADGFIKVLVRACTCDDWRRRPEFGQIVAELKHRKDFLPGMDEITCQDFFRDCEEQTRILPKYKAIMEGRGMVKPPAAHMDDFEKLMRDAETGNAVACLKLSRIFAKGDARHGKDLNKSAEYAKRASDLGHNIGHYNYAVCLAEGEGVEKDLHKAKEYFEKAMEGHFPRAFVQHALILEQEKREEEALEEFKEAARLGFPTAYYYLGQRYERAERLEEAHTYYDEAYRGKVKLAGVDLARMEIKGLGCDKNEKKGVDILEKLGKENIEEALVGLANLYKIGRDVAKNPKEACRLFQQAYDNGSLSACVGYAQLLFDKDSGVLDVDKGLEVIDKAIKGGYHPAKVVLADHYLQEGDEGRAAALYKDAAQKGVAAAMFKYSECLELGRGVDKDPREARKWLERAADRNYSAALEKLGRK